jgi:actin-binding protein IPP
VLDHYLYVVGGINRQHEVLQSVERYNFLEVRIKLLLLYGTNFKWLFVNQDQWTEIPSLNRGRASPAVAAADGLLYVMGGDHSHEVNFYRARITMTSVECFNPLTNSWSERPPLPESRSEAGAVVV